MVISLESHLTEEDISKFSRFYQQIVKGLSEDTRFKDIPTALTWLERVVDYNVPYGKKVRGLMVPATFKCLVSSPSEEEMTLTYALGWCIEILQAACLVADDIMDKSETRRGNPCWYKVDNLGSTAFNDAQVLAYAAFDLLQKYFSEKSYYRKVVDHLLDVIYKTILGQSLDTHTGKDRNVEDYTLERYATIVKYKTSYYTTFLPIVVAMDMAEKNDPEVEEIVKQISLEIGQYFQVQDDYLDCFGDEQKTGKIGTDILDCKCSWLFVTAREKCSPEQWQLLKDNYGYDDKDKVEVVKSLYKEMDIAREFERYEENTYNRIYELVAKVCDRFPEEVFTTLLDVIHKRAK